MMEPLGGSSNLAKGKDANLLREEELHHRVFLEQHEGHCRPGAKEGALPQDSLKGEGSRALGLGVGLGVSPAGFARSA